MEAAIETFLAHGFEDSSIDAIARRARSSKTTIYQYFANKNALFVAAVRQVVQASSASERDHRNDPREPAIVLQELGRWVHKNHLRADNLGLYRANIIAASHFPELAADIHRFRLTAAWPLLDYIRLLAERGIIEVADSTEAARRFGVLSIDGMRHLMGFPAAAKSEVNKLVARNVALFLSGAHAVRTDASEFDVPALSPVTKRPRPRGLRMPQERIDEILAASQQEFLQNGLKRASVHNIAAATGVGKMTIYRHFADKNGLFEAAILFAIDRLGEVDPNVAAHDLETVLFELAARILERFIQPECLALHRLVIGEAPRFPALARKVYDAFAGAAMLKVAGILQTGRFRIASPAAAARQFLVLALNGNRILTDAQLPEANARAKIAEEAVRLFLSGYGSRKSATRKSRTATVSVD